MRSAAQSVHLVAASVGFLSYLLLWATVVWGALLGRGWTMTRFKYSNVYAAHMTLALIGMTLGWGHAFTQLANPTGPVFLIDEFVPFVNGADRIGIGVGVVATEVMTAVLVSVPLQRRLGYRRWRGVHSLAYASFTLLAGHVLLAGSDVGPPYVKIPVIALWLSTVVLWLVLPRLRRKAGAARERPADQRAEVRVDPGRCTRVGACERAAPDVFELRPDGRLGHRTSVSGDQVDAAARAMKACPVRAISMRRAGPTPRADEPLATVTELRRR